MARRGKSRPAVKEILDATEERLQRAAEEAGSEAEAWDYVDPSRIDSHNSIGLVRRFKASHLDRLYRHDDPKRSALTFRQWYAGCLYRQTHVGCGFSTCVTSSFGERVSGTEPAYGMPRSQRQADARMLWREARRSFSSSMADLMDRFLLHDFIPGYASTRAGKRGREAYVGLVRVELDLLADFFRLNREQKAA